MTRFNPPLTPAETTALQQACAEMDTQRLHRIEFCERLEGIHQHWYQWATKHDDDEYADECIVNLKGRHLAAAVLAGQMAARL